jgi:hypothetical protein
MITRRLSAIRFVLALSLLGVVIAASASGAPTDRSRPGRPAVAWSKRGRPPVPSRPGRPAPSASSAVPAASAAPPSSDCGVDGQEADCELLDRLGAWATLAANEGTGASVLLAKDVCATYVQSLQSLQLIVDARIKASAESGSREVYERWHDVALPGRYAAFAELCATLDSGGDPDAMSIAAKTTVVDSKTGRVTLSDAARRARQIAIAARDP